MNLKIVETIRKQGFTAREVANKLNMDPNNLSRYDAKKRKITLETAYEISKIIGCKVDDLINEE
ncbi:helix-turn-helix transcriptional regulator [Gracilibacillus oryzae]|uniref:Helix-turn-helix transcriptional regulator n=1 Tax=Gracilibacillus oryzae TaxID=1672701 RepID=A0A7C8KWU1_9BACI|nr:helix-turn-helix transcriptional regulator [Gracilibacillus oryzae]KAB8138422.1 helix-turn-helix transcriptional regulator [Gracilibacillus oryzae]